MSNLAVVSSSVKCCNKCKEYLPFSLFSKNIANLDKLSAHCKECDKKIQTAKRRKSPEKVLSYSREYQKKKRESFDYRLQMLLNASKQRATKKNLEHTITIKDLKEFYPVNGNCPVFGFKLNFGTAGFRDHSPSIDRIDSSKGYTKDNIQIISWKANRIKGFATIKELDLLLSYLKQGE